MTLRHTPTPQSTGLTGSTIWSQQCVAYITGVGHYRVVSCTGETALTICGSPRITTIDSCMERRPSRQCLESELQIKRWLHLMLKQIKPSPFLVSWHLSKLGQHPCICSLLFWSVGSHIHMSALNMVIESQCIATKFNKQYDEITQAVHYESHTQ